MSIFGIGLNPIIKLYAALYQPTGASPWIIESIIVSILMYIIEKKESIPSEIAVLIVLLKKLYVKFL